MTRGIVINRKKGKHMTKKVNIKRERDETSELWSAKEIPFSNSHPVNPFWSFSYVIAWFYTHLFSLWLSVPSAGTSITHTHSWVTLDCRARPFLCSTLQYCGPACPRNISPHFTLIERDKWSCGYSTVKDLKTSFRSVPLYVRISDGCDSKRTHEGEGEWGMSPRRYLDHNSSRCLNTGCYVASNEMQILISVVAPGRFWTWQEIWWNSREILTFRMPFK